jgi:hypothetical protein
LLRKEQIRNGKQHSLTLHYCIIAIPFLSLSPCILRLGLDVHCTIVPNNHMIEISIKPAQTTGTIFLCIDRKIYFHIAQFQLGIWGCTVLKNGKNEPDPQ